VPLLEGATGVLGLAIVLAGCHPAARSEPRTEWRPTGDRPEPYAQARAACEKEALAKTARIQSEPTATVAAAAAFADCMRGRGWVATQNGES
jgi:hypothetical protein